MKHFDHQMAAGFQPSRSGLGSQLRKVHGPGLIRRSITAHIRGHVGQHQVQLGARQNRLELLVRLWLPVGGSNHHGVRPCGHRSRIADDQQPACQFLFDVAGPAARRSAELEDLQTRSEQPEALVDLV